MRSKNYGEHAFDRHGDGYINDAANSEWESWNAALTFLFNGD
jgi:hypothetical protein